MDRSFAPVLQIAEWKTALTSTTDSSKNGNPRRLNLSDADREAFVDFMLTLKDESLAADERLSHPFIR